MTANQVKTQGNDTSLVATLPTLALGDFPVGSVESRAAARALLGKRQREAETVDMLEKITKLGGTRPDGTRIVAPLYWLENFTETFDEHWKDKGTEAYARYPRFPYTPWLFRHFLKCSRLFVPKSREMMTTWAAVAYAVWLCQFSERTRAIIQTQKEDKVIDLIKGAGVPGYARTLYERQPGWLQEAYPLTTPSADDQPAARMSWANGSILQGVPKGADQVRQYHPTLYIADEAAHVDEFKESYAAADPVCMQMIAISSAGPGWFGESCVEESGKVT